MPTPTSNEKILTAIAGACGIVPLRANHIFDSQDAPTVNDDVTQGFSPFSVWFRNGPDGPNVYVCNDPAAGGADWEEQT